MPQQFYIKIFTGETDRRKKNENENSNQRGLNFEKCSVVDPFHVIALLEHSATCTMKTTIFLLFCYTVSLLLLFRSKFFEI